MILLAAELAAAGYLPGRRGQLALDLAWAVTATTAWQATDAISHPVALVVGGGLVAATLTIRLPGRLDPPQTPIPAPRTYDPLATEPPTYGTPPGGHHA